jgi:hypothetical protein
MDDLGWVAVDMDTTRHNHDTSARRANNKSWPPNKFLNWAAEEVRKSRHTLSSGGKQPALLIANRHRYSVSKALAPSRDMYVS